jgi:hypothetical protein
VRIGIVAEVVELLGVVAIAVVGAEAAMRRIPR